MEQIDLYNTADAEAAYQGAPGAYSEEAARQLLGEAARLMPCATLEQTFDAVSEGRAGHAVVAIEDAHAGTVPQIYDLLLASDLVVSQETSINVDHVLMAPPGVPRRDIRRVLSHPIALGQCADFFRQNRHIEAVSVFDTAGAVRMIVENGETSTAAIASHRAAALYGAEILAEHIQDYPDNWTRFVLLSKRDTVPADAQKAIVAFGLRHEPGALVTALTPIAEHGLSIAKIEGRPIGGTPIEYRFIVEMTAAPGQSIPDGVYEALSGATTWLRPLGAFRV